MSDRPSLDEYMLNLAQVVATRSTCSRLHVGAILARGGRVLSTGYNGAPSGDPHCVHVPDEDLDTVISCTVSVHAEANAIYQAQEYRVPTEGADLFLTHSPCLGCSSILLKAGIRRVVFAQRYRSDEGAVQLAVAGVQVEMR